MSFYKSAIIVFGVQTVENIVNSYHSATALAFTFDSVDGATGYEYTTDGGTTFRTIVSGVNFTVDSNNDALVADTHYYVQIRSVDSDSDDKSNWSEVFDVFTSTASPPSGKTLNYILSGEGIYLRAGVLDDGGAVCQICFEVDTVNTAWMNGYYTGDIGKQFKSIDYSTEHKYRLVLKNMADTTYGDFITIPPLDFVDHTMRAYKYV